MRILGTYVSYVGTMRSTVQQVRVAYSPAAWRLAALVLVKKAASSISYYVVEIRIVLPVRNLPYVDHQPT